MINLTRTISSNRDGMDYLILSFFDHLKIKNGQMKTETSDNLDGFDKPGSENGDND
ncbi:MAG: hypothetical protein KG003_06460 [Bacteroidetes bacterium]|nr:hypothetical protein [Bacteroidota bacterium]